ncbi:terminase [Streptomyces sp. NBC_01201]|uniref:terminase n=1 Tax=unclassified Streptomyces TaxID=2593676 RepID=UPI002E0E0521|nr:MULTISPECIES: terminase [unclassified Streptomyces]WSR09411.1 terminase [Streptomyces sp. NBC_01208]WSR47861.1 terminase [Streptomyces sp. NBC_01201]
MTSLIDERSAVAPDKPAGQWGVQRPRLFTAPSYTSSAGQEAIELAAHAGLVLDDWQQHALHVGLGERADGSWAAFEVAVNVPRQNGKGGIIEARELAGLFLLGERLILHSAHEFKTSIEAFRRIVALVTNCDSLRKRVKAIRRTTGEEAIELLSGQRLRFLARSGGSGRGFTGNCNVLDEDMILGDDAMGALMPTMAAVKDPQVWYFGSAGIGSPSQQLARLRRRALAAVENGEPDPSLAYMEWSINPHVRECPPGCTDHDDPLSPLSVAKANPALGYRLTLEHTERERLTMSDEIFARERLGVGDYPSDGEDTWRVISEDVWRALADGTSAMADPVSFAVDVTPERSHAAICAAGRSGEAVHVEVVDHRPGTGWVVERLVELVEKWEPCAVVIDPGGPAGSLIPAVRKELEVLGLPDLLIEPKTREIAGASGQFFDAVASQAIVHLDQAPLSTALAGADKRPVGDGWAWARRGVSVDISPLVGCTLAVWGHAERADVEPEGAPNLW